MRSAHALNGAATAAGAFEAAVTLLDLLARARVSVDTARAQEAVYEASVAGLSDELEPLGLALGLKMGDLGVPP